MITYYCLAFLLAATWASGICLVTFAIIGMSLDRAKNDRSAKGISRDCGKPRPR